MFHYVLLGLLGVDFLEQGLLGFIYVFLEILGDPRSFKMFRNTRINLRERRNVARVKRPLHVYVISHRAHRL